MPQSDFASIVGQYPLNAGGALGQNAFFTLGQVNIGTGGMPVPQRQNPTGIATGLLNARGFNGFGVTLIGTGLYQVTHPPALNAAVFPQYVGLSGMAANLTPQWSPGNSASGGVRIQATTQNGAGFSGMGTQPSGAQRIPFNPPSGTRFDLLFFINPKNDQGLTQY